MKQTIKLAILDSTIKSIKSSLEGSIFYEIVSKENIVNEIVDNKVDALILDIPDQDAFLEIVRKVRANLHTYLLPIFCIENKRSLYVDESFVSLELVKKLVIDIGEQCDVLTSIIQTDKRITRDWQLRMLTYLYTRRFF